jgi:hypothetical protein
MRATAAIASMVMLLAAGLVAAPRASAGIWTVAPNVVNATGASAVNCYGYMTNGSMPTGCIFSSGVTIDDGAWTEAPGPVIATQAPYNTNRSVFVAPNFDEGADGYVSYTMPDGSSYNLTFEDDESSGGQDGTYAACAEDHPQDSPYACDVSFGPEPYNAALPSVTFSPDGQAENLGVGQRCSASLSAGQTYNCTASGQFSVANRTQNSNILFQNPNPNTVTLNTIAGDSPCQMTQGQQCDYTGDPNNITQLTMTADSGSGSYAVEVVSISVGPTPWTRPPDYYAPGTYSYSARVVTGNRTAHVANRRPGLKLVPSAAHGAPSGPELSELRVSPAHFTAGRGRGTTISYRARRSGTLVLTISRRQGHRWVRMRHSGARSWLWRQGIRQQGGRCRLSTRPPTPPGVADCMRKFTLSGHLADRHGAGRRSMRFHGRLNGRPLAPGGYRLSAITRVRGSTHTSRHIRARFWVRAGRSH